MSVRLFHVTEFAESAFLSPQVQREACHPFLLILMASVWLAAATNLPLWFTLMRDAGGNTATPWWLAPGLLLLMTLVLCAGLGLLAWRWTLKPALVLLLLLAAVNTHLLLKHGLYFDAAALARLSQASWPEVRAFVGWQFLATVLILGVLPAVLAWRLPVRRRTPWQNLWQNAVFLLAIGGLLLGWWRLATPELFDFAGSQQARLNPFNSLFSLLPDPPSIARP